MKTLPLRSSAFLAFSGLLLGAAPAAFAADLVLQKVPPLTVEQTPAYPANLARHQLGARVETASNNATSIDLSAAEKALLSGDPAASLSLPAGKTTVLVALAKIENVGKISFATQGVEGNVNIATASAKLAADSSQWHRVAEEKIAATGFNAKVVPGEAKYVRLAFDLTQPGKISGFGVYADPLVSDFTAPRSGQKAKNDGSSFGLVSYNYTDMHGKARALYVSSGSDLRQANNMIDDQTATSYSFAANDGAPATVIDLGKPVSLRRLSAVYSPRAGKVDFYVLNALPIDGAAAVASSDTGRPIPAPQDVPPTFTVTDAALAQMKAVGSATDDGKQGRAAVEFPEVTGRYVMVRWSPAVQQDSALTVAEIAALGGPKTTLVAANTNAGGVEETDEYGTAGDGKTMIDGKTTIDSKDMPGEGPPPPGEPPPLGLPQPPPFTFVPVLVPNSP